MDKKKLLKSSQDSLRNALSMPGVLEWGSEVEAWLAESKDAAVGMGMELASAKRVFDEIVEKIVESYGFPMPPREPDGLLNGFCSSFAERFDDGIDVRKEVGIATLERFTAAVKSGMEK